MSKRAKKVWTIIISCLVAMGLIAGGAVFAVNYLFSEFFNASLSFMESSAGVTGDTSGETDTADTPDTQQEPAASGPEDTRTPEEIVRDSVADAGITPPGTQPKDAGEAPKKSSISNTNLRDLESKISLADKAKILSMCFSVLSTEEYNKYLSMAADGLSGEELAAAQRILSERLTAEQKSVIWSYYNKYIN